MHSGVHAWNESPATYGEHDEQAADVNVPCKNRQCEKYESAQKNRAKLVCYKKKREREKNRERFRNITGGDRTCANESRNSVIRGKDTPRTRTQYSEQQLPIISV